MDLTFLNFYKFSYISNNKKNKKKKIFPTFLMSLKILRCVAP